MTDTFHSISPFGTGDIKTGSPNIVIASGVATLSVAQTGNIGIGCAIEYNSLICYISRVNSSTSFNVVTVIGGTPSDQSSVAVTSIHHVWASLADAVSNFTGASFLNTTDLVTNEYTPYLCCYYDHDDSTADAGVATLTSITTSTTYKPIIIVPRGGTESINDQRFDYKYDANKYILNTYSSSGLLVIDGVGYCDVIGIQGYNVSTSGSSCCISVTGAVTEINIINTITQRGRRPIFTTHTSGTVNLINSIVLNGGEGCLKTTTSILNVYFCTIDGLGTTAYGCFNEYGTLNIKDSVVTGCTDDFYTYSTIAVTYTASDDNDVAGTGNFQLTQTVAERWNDSVNGDYNLITGSELIEGADPISGITLDIIGTTRDVTNPDIGAFELISGPTTGPILKKYIGDTWVAVTLRKYSGTWDLITLKKYISAAWTDIDTDAT